MNELIDQKYYNFTSQFLSDNIINVYIDNTCTQVGHLTNLISYVDSIVNFEFKIVDNAEDAEMRFYETNDIPGDYLGYAVPKYGISKVTTYSETVYKPYWNLLIRKDSNYESLKAYVYTHEFGHALGFEHPYDNSDGDVWTTATTQDTVMTNKYLPKVNEDWMFRQVEIDTITGLYNKK